MDCSLTPGCICRTEWKMIGIVVFLFLLCAALFIRMLWEKEHFEVTEYTIEDPSFHGNDGPVRAVVLADLHNHVYGEGNEKLLAAIEKCDPSCIFIAGDMPVAVPGKSVAPAADLVEALSKKYPIYYGIGNHEYRMRIYPERYKDAYHDYDQRLKGCGVSMLHNERRTIRLGNVEADVYGLEIDRRYYKRFKKTPMEQSYLEETLPKPREGVYRILLAHNPEYFDAYTKWGANLTLSGHVHGGVVRVFGRGLVSPKLGLFPPYSGGIYEKKGRKMLVSRGLGAHTIPVRLFNRPELVVLCFDKCRER